MSIAIPLLPLFLSLLGLPLLGAIQSLRRIGRKHARYVQSVAQQDDKATSEPLRQTVSKCEGRWFLEDLKLAMIGDDEAGARVGCMLMAGFGMKQEDSGRWLQDVWAIQNFKQARHGFLDPVTSESPRLPSPSSAEAPCPKQSRASEHPHQCLAAASPQAAAVGGSHAEAAVSGACHSSPAGGSGCDLDALSWRGSDACWEDDDLTSEDGSERGEEDAAGGDGLAARWMRRRRCSLEVSSGAAASDGFGGTSNHCQWGRAGAKSDSSSFLTGRHRWRGVRRVVSDCGVVPSELQKRLLAG